MQPAVSPTPLSVLRRLGGTRALVVLLAAVVSLACALPSAAGGAQATNPVSRALSVLNPGGRAAKLLRQVTLPQLAAAMNTTPAQLGARIQNRFGGAGAKLELSEVTVDPNATVGEVIERLAAGGVSAEQVEQLLNSLLGEHTETAEQLRSVIETLLGDIAHNGRLEALAKELGLPVSSLEGAHFIPSTAEAAAEVLETTTAGLGSLLGNVGSAASRLSPASPLAVDQLEAGAAGTKVLVGASGAPGAPGGVTLVTISSTSPPGSQAGVLGSKTSVPSSGAFAILSIRVGKGGVIIETVNVPAQGRVAVSASVTRSTAAKARHGVRRVIRRTATVGSSALQTGAGTATITVRLRPGALRARRVPVTLATTYTPTAGAPSTIRRTVSVTLAGASKHRRHH